MVVGTAGRQRAGRWSPVPPRGQANGMGRNTCGAWQAPCRAPIWSCRAGGRPSRHTHRPPGSGTRRWTQRRCRCAAAAGIWPTATVRTLQAILCYCGDAGELGDFMQDGYKAADDLQMWVLGLGWAARACWRAQHQTSIMVAAHSSHPRYTPHNFF
jgi:hypothetical protein